MMDTIEKMARAMCRAYGDKWDAKDHHETSNGETPEEQRNYWRDNARAAYAVASEEIAEGTGEAVMPDIYERARALRNAVLWQSNASVEHIVSALKAERGLALEEAEKWHEKNARYCREIAADEPRLNLDTRDRAKIAAAHHDASAVGIRRLSKPHYLVRSLANSVTEGESE